MQEKFSISVNQFISNIKMLEAESENRTESITSWARKFFAVENRVVVDPKTGVESSLKFDVCKLPIEANGSGTYGKAYKHNLGNGTKNLQRHLIDKHRFSVAIQSIIASENITIPKVTSERLVV